MHLAEADDAPRAGQADRADQPGREEEAAVSTATTPAAVRRPDFRAASPLLFDVAVPVGLYYLLSAAGRRTR